MPEGFAVGLSARKKAESECALFAGIELASESTSAQHELSGVIWPVRLFTVKPAAADADHIAVTVDVIVTPVGGTVPKGIYPTVKVFVVLPAETDAAAV